MAHSFAFGMPVRFQRAAKGMRIAEVLSRPWMAWRPGGYFRNSGDGIAILNHL